MARPRTYLKPFDVTADYHVLRNFPLRGVMQRAGTAFDKTQVNKRHLRLFYESRLIGIDVGSGIIAQTAVSRMTADRFNKPVRQRVGTDPKTGKYIYALFHNGKRVLSAPPAVAAQTADVPSTAESPRPRVRIRKAVA